MGSNPAAFGFPSAGVAQDGDDVGMPDAPQDLFIWGIKRTDTILQ